MKYIFTILYTIVSFSFLEAQPSCVQISTSNTSCGLNNGVASVYSICCGNISEVIWSNGATGTSVTGLPPGAYGVYVETDGSCFYNLDFVIQSSSPMPLSTAFTNTTCGEANGSAAMINLDSIGGFSPIYSWSTGANQSSISNLAAGLYTVTVYEFDPTGAEGCVQSFDFTIDPSSGIVGGLNTSSTTCNQANGSIVAFASGGGGSYTYEWSTGQTSSAIYNLSAATYSVSIHSADGCTPLTLSDEVAPSTAITGSIASTPTTCNLANGSLEAMATGGGSNHTYIWSNGQTTASITNITAGDYSVIIHSSDGCTPLNLSGNVAKSTALIATIEEQHTTCGASNGSLSANANHNGTTYVWNTGATGSIIENLKPGSYAVTATDDDGCVSTATSIINPSQGFDLSVIQDGNTLVASTQIFTLYEWLDCSNYAPIPGAENMTYTPPSNGLYAVAVYNGNFNGITCRDTSECIEYILSATDEATDIAAAILCTPISHGIIALDASNEVSIYGIKIYNVNGQMLYQSGAINSDQYMADVSSIPEGALFIHCITSRGMIVKRMLKI